MRFFDPKASCFAVKLSFDYVLFELETSFHKPIHNLVRHRLIHLVAACVADKYRTVFTFFKDSMQLFCDFFHFIGKFVDVVNVRQVVVKFTLAVFDNVCIGWVRQNKIYALVICFAQITSVALYDFLPCVVFNFKVKRGLCSF